MQNIYYEGKIYEGHDGRTGLLLNPLPSFEVVGSHPFTNGQQVVLGKDYEHGYQWQTDFKGKGKKWEDCTWAVYSMAHVAHRRIVALAIDKKEEKKSPLTILLEKMSALKPINKGQEVGISVVNSIITETLIDGLDMTLLDYEKQYHAK